MQNGSDVTPIYPPDGENANAMWDFKKQTLISY